MLTLRVALMAWGVVGPVVAGGVAYLAMLAREHIVVAGAAAAARGEEISKCNEARLAIGRTIDEAVAAGVAEAVAAARGEARSPSAPADLIALCKVDWNCRGREATP